MARSFRMAALLSALLTCAAASTAQQPQPASASPNMSSAAITLGHSAVPLYGPWKFTIGDSPVDPATNQPLWAEPGFDDSHWETVDLAPQNASANRTIGTTGYVSGWGAHGHANTPGYGWYRIHVSVHAPLGEDLALAGPVAFDDAYQVFLNGTLLGGFGFRPEGPQLYYAQPVVFPLMQAFGPHQEDATQVIAFRFWMSPTTLLTQVDSGGLHTAPLLGTAGAVSGVYQLGWLELACENAVTVLSALVFSLLTVMAFALFLFNRNDNAYLWMAVPCLFVALVNWEFAMAALAHEAFTVQTDLWFGNVLVVPLTRFGWFMLFRSWFHLERPRWMPWAVALLTLVQATGYAGAFNLIPFFPFALAPIFLAIAHATMAVYLVLLCWLQILGVRKLRTEGWLLMAVFLLTCVDWLASRLPSLHLSQAFSPFGISITSLQIEGLVIAIALCALLIRRWILSAQEQRQVALDIKQAQEVQQVILPLPRMILPGLVVESDYRPSREVGGDFFQLLPNQTDGSLLIVAGDVTGKGLRAGMVVALLVGAIRTAAQYDPDPLTLLNTLNLRLLGRADSQATCLALHIDRNGSATLANAGHMAPYLNGEPIEMEGALPLGMIEDAHFSVMHFNLSEGDRLMLLSDGIAEATDTSGKLFGFDRVRDLLRATITASEVATAAQSYGQEDDISVISVTRSATPIPVS